ncbi:MAG: hypothetical protein IPL08_10055 [Saprospiraceae bacterium]|nr:hypothetical protein [Saprospiraceae bacterium]
MKHNIDHILDKYWEGESSVEDENILKKYYRSGEVHADHAPYKSLFSYLDAQRDIQYDERSIIDTLLNKYWEGSTTVEEEYFLKKYFSSENIDEAHKPYMELFMYFEDRSAITYPVKEVQLVSESRKVKWATIRKMVYSVAAASVLVLGAVSVMKNMQPDPIQSQTAMAGEIEDPEEALRVTKEALALVSSKFRDSQDKVRHNMGALEKASLFK